VPLENLKMSVIDLIRVRGLWFYLVRCWLLLNRGRMGRVAAEFTSMTTTRLLSLGSSTLIATRTTKRHIPILIFRMLIIGTIIESERDGLVIVSWQRVATSS